MMEIHQVLVICEDLDGERGAMEIVLPRLQGMDNGEELPVIYIIVAFCWDE